MNWTENCSKLTNRKIIEVALQRFTVLFVYILFNRPSVLGLFLNSAMIEPLGHQLFDDLPNKPLKHSHRCIMSGTQIMQYLKNKHRSLPWYTFNQKYLIAHWGQNLATITHRLLTTPVLWSSNLCLAKILVYKYACTADCTLQCYKLVSIQVSPGFLYVFVSLNKTVPGTGCWRPSP